MNCSKVRLFLPLLLYPSVVLLGAGRAEAVLVFNFVQRGSNVELQGSGSLNGLPSVLSSGIGTSPSAIWPINGMLLLGKNQYTNYNLYTITGPANFGTGLLQYLSLTYSSNNHISLQGSTSQFSIDPDYVEGSSITYSGVFANTTLADLGLSSTSGLLAEYSIGSDAIQVYAGPVPAPAPVPWIGGIAAFGFSRRLRFRIRSRKDAAQA